MTLAHLCDQCDHRIGHDIRLTATVNGLEVEFCSITCLTVWATSIGHVEETPDADPAEDVDGKPQDVTPDPATDLTTRTCEECGRVGQRRYLRTATGWRCSPTATACPGNATCTCKSAPGKYCPAHGDPTPADLPPADNGDVSVDGVPADVAPETGTADTEFCIHCMQHRDHHDREVMACPVRGGFSTFRTFEACEVPLTPTVEPEPRSPESVPPPASEDAEVATARCQDCRRTWTITGEQLTAEVEQHELKRSHIVMVWGES